MVLENHCYLKLNHCPLTWIMPLSFYMFGYVLSASLLGVNCAVMDKIGCDLHDFRKTCESD